MTTAIVGTGGLGSGWPPDFRAAGACTVGLEPSLRLGKSDPAKPFLTGLDSAQ
jgi:hypothetical protein